MKAPFIFILLVSTVAGLSPAHSQVSPNQHEMMRQHGLDCSQRYDGCNNSSQPQRRPSEVWQNYYGAIAVDPQAKKGGISENETSLRRARSVAIKNCGTRNCVIRAETTNGCLATAYGGGGTYYGSGDTADAATQEAVKNCQADGSTCEPRYLHCNYPVRIR